MGCGKVTKKLQMGNQSDLSDPYIICISCNHHGVDDPDSISKGNRPIFNEFTNGIISKVHCCRVLRCVDIRVKEQIDGR